MWEVVDLPATLGARIIVDAEPRDWEEHPPGACWLWQGRWGTQNGYGLVRHGARKQWLVHRLVWTLLVCAIPPSMVLNHKCRRRRCVNPTHLEILTPRENVMIGDAVLYGKRAAL